MRFHYSALGALALLISPLASALALAEPPNPQNNNNRKPAHPNTKTGIPASAKPFTHYYPNFLKHLPPETEMESHTHGHSTFYELSTVTADTSNPAKQQQTVIIVTRFSSLSSPPTERPWVVGGQPMVLVFTLDIDLLFQTRAYAGLAPKELHWLGKGYDQLEAEGEFEDLPAAAALIMDTPIRSSPLSGESLSATWVNDAIETLDDGGVWVESRLPHSSR